MNTKLLIQTTAWVMARLVMAARNLLVMIGARLTGFESRKSAVHSVSSIETSPTP